MRAGRARTRAALVAMACAGACRSAHPPPQPQPGTTPGTAVIFAEPIVELRAAIGQRQTHDVRLAGPAAARARLAIQLVEDPALHAQVLAGDGATPAGLRLSFTGDRAGTRTGQVIVTTDVAEAPRLTLLYSLAVPTLVTVTPSNPYFNLRDPGARQRVLRVRGARPGFRVLEARVIAGPFVAAVLPAEASSGASPDEVTVRVGVAAGAVTTDQRGLLGTLRLRTNDATQPEVDVPLFAMGALPHAPAMPEGGDGGRPP